MKTFLLKLLSALAERRTNRLLEQLDERTLRDIGLETQANRARELGRLHSVRFGMY
ncbi:MAG TPA: hypothetical protein VD965_12820 [Burkholderiales bacterium]|nr:hypothetical protein [Burkholderiales bacterium]